MDKFNGEVALLLAWLLALAASLAALFIGEAMGQTPCWVCWIQRIFMFPLAIILGLGLWWEDRSSGRYGLALALPGGTVGLWHLALYGGLIPERLEPCSADGPSCTDANQLILGVPIPLLSVISFFVIAALCAAALKDKRS